MVVLSANYVKLSMTLRLRGIASAPHKVRIVGAERKSNGDSERVMDRGLQKLRLA